MKVKTQILNQSEWVKNKPVSEGKDKVNQINQDAVPKINSITFFSSNGITSPFGFR